MRFFLICISLFAFKLSFPLYQNYFSLLNKIKRKINLFVSFEPHLIFFETQIFCEILLNAKKNFSEHIAFIKSAQNLLVCNKSILPDILKSKQKVSSYHSHQCTGQIECRFYLFRILTDDDILTKRWRRRWTLCWHNSSRELIESENDYNLLQKPRKNGFSVTVNATLLILLLILYKLKMYLSLIINCQCSIVE